ncbi:hypothetical protein ZYGR_0I04730 [Zygosaccharomyces rouxii]|uniref:FAD-binding FR-type domain-containing protein n=1 Tax=Zygosaccharomyces rouxii TaxID=4956 RepID=A0A1Q2ZXC1_ZYGRO|nr:hypothetical protein ZYGR_0I04730 [Zygosaccharomyces rouxii]
MKLRPPTLLIKNYYKRCYSHRFTQLPQERRIRLSGVLMMGAIGVSALSYYYYSILRQQQSQELSPTHFIPYKISHKIDIDPSHFLLELTPLQRQKVNLWSQMGSEHLWSVEVKQPEIMVVRSYTPLPLQVDENQRELKAIPDGSNGDGKFVLYVKQYGNGEVARWLHRLPLGHTIDVRGPFVEYELPKYEGEISRNRDFLFNDEISSTEEDKFKYQPFDIAMFTAGTGIVSALQILLTESPLRGKMHLRYSCGSVDVLGPLKPFLYQLHRYGRIDLQVLESSKESNVSKRQQKIWDQIPSPTNYLGPSNYLGPNKISSPVLALVCGPERYIADISGPRINLAQGPIGGMLKAKGWTEGNVYKLS